MTKLTDRLAAHPLMEKNFKYIKPSLQEASSRLKKLLEETGKFRYEGKVVVDDADFYHISVFRKASSLLNGIERLEFTQRFIKQFPSPRSYEKQGINQYSWIEYHYSFFIVTFNSFYDMALVLVNTVLQLGNPDKNCKPYIIEDNNQVKDTSIGVALKKIKKITSPYRSERNLYVHRGELPDVMSITESEMLDTLRLFSAAHLHSDPIVPLDLLDSVYKHESSKICLELGSEIERISEAAAQLFSSLLPIYIFRARIFEKRET